MVDPLEATIKVLLDFQDFELCRPWAFSLSHCKSKYLAYLSHHKGMYLDFEGPDYFSMDKVSNPWTNWIQLGKTQKTHARFHKELHF